MTECSVYHDCMLIDDILQNCQFIFPNSSPAQFQHSPFKTWIRDEMCVELTGTSTLCCRGLPTFDTLFMWHGWASFHSCFHFLSIYPHEFVVIYWLSMGRRNDIFCKVGR